MDVPQGLTCHHDLPFRPVTQMICVEGALRQGLQTSIVCSIPDLEMPLSCSDSHLNRANFDGSKAQVSKPPHSRLAPVSNSQHLQATVPTSRSLFSMFGTSDYPVNGR